MTRKVLDTATFTNQWTNEEKTYEFVLNTKKGYYSFCEVYPDGRRRSSETFKDDKNYAIHEWIRKFNKNYKG